MPNALAKQTLLRYHIAFSQLCKGEGTLEFDGDLMTMIYMVFLLLERALSDEGLKALALAEVAFRRDATRAEGVAPVPLSYDERAAIEAVLAEYDHLLKVTPLHRLAAAKTKLTNLYEGGFVVTLAALQDRAYLTSSNATKFDCLYQSIVERVLAQ